MTGNTTLSNPEPSKWMIQVVWQKIVLVIRAGWCFQQTDDQAVRTGWCFRQMDDQASWMDGCFYWMDDQSLPNGCKFFWMAKKRLLNRKPLIVYVLLWKFTYHDMMNQGDVIETAYPLIFQSDLTWPLWVWYYIVAVSSGALKGIYN